MKPEDFETDLYEKCKTERNDSEKDKYICNSCKRYMQKSKIIPPQAQNNELHLNTMFKEISDLCPLELSLVSQIIPFMFITDKHKGAQKGLKGHVVLVPADLTKVERALPRQYNKGHLIAIALKRRLSDKSAYSKTYIRPDSVNTALAKLRVENDLYMNVTISTDWERINEADDPKLWKLLTDEFYIEDDTNQEPEENTHSDIIEDMSTSKEKESNESESDDTDVEGDAFSKEKAQIYYPTAFHNTHGPEVTSEKIIEVAPGEGQIPISIYKEKNWEAMAFVKQYSEGKFHFNTERPTKISVSKYIHARLKCCDNRFSSDPQYVFQCLNWIEEEIVRSTISLVERKRKQNSWTIRDIQNPSVVQELITDAEIYASFKSIRGTPQYFHEMTLDVLAKCRQFGPPTFFITFSAAEFHWADIIQTVARQYGEYDLSEDDIATMNWDTKKSYLKRNPVTVARQIDYRFRQLWNKILLSGMHPIGQILNYDDKREVHDRGTFHCHATVHVKDAPVFDKDDNDDITRFIDKYISCSLPDAESNQELHRLVSTVQKHNHTRTCRKKVGVKCRFNAPWAATDKTTIVGATESKNEYRKANKCIGNVLTEMNRLGTGIASMTLSELLQRCGVTSDEYEKSMASSSRRCTIYYKRKLTESLIVPYNPVLLHAWKANMNIQYVTGEYGVLTYLTSYLCKPERSMSELMKLASQEAAGKSIRQRLYQIGKVFKTKREVSTHEAIVRCISIPLRHSNIDVVYVPTGPKESITRMLKSNRSLKNNDDQDSTDIYQPNLLEKYCNRPVTDEMNDMCFADFASMYKSDNSLNPKLDREDLENYFQPISDFKETDESKDKIVLQEGMGKMKKRSRDCVIRWHKVSQLKEPEKYFLCMLQLFLPWRDENELLANDGKYSSKFIEVENYIQPNMLKHQPFKEYDYEDLQDPDDAIIDSDNETDDSDKDGDDEYQLYPGILDIPHDPYESAPVTNSSVSNITTIPDEEYYHMCSTLNKKQQILFNYIMRQVQDYKNDEDGLHSDPFYIFLSGGGGVGKSHLVKVIAEYVKRNLKFRKQNLDQPSIMLTASTGKAASHIGGVTLHSAFHIPCKKSKNDEETEIKIPNKVLSVLKKKYRYLKMIVIDEISMTGLDTFEYLDIYLQSITNSDEAFGGISILAVGDFLQLPPVCAQSVFEDSPKPLSALAGNVWERKFKLHELTEIVRQVSDPEFADILSRVREGKQTKEDCDAIEELNQTDKSDWQHEPVKLYTKNLPADDANKDSISQLRNEIITIVSKDKGRIPEGSHLNQTGNLPREISICIGARFMLTVNLDTEDHLINGSIGTIKWIHKSGEKLDWTLYIEFDDPIAGNKLKIPQMGQWVPIKSTVKSFSVGNSQENSQRKQFPGILAHAITIHKSQGSTYNLMEGHLDGGVMCSKPGMMYTMLSRAQNRQGIKLYNFKSNMLHHNKKALDEIIRMRTESSLTTIHPLSSMTSPTIMLLNIRSWNSHIAEITNDPVYLKLCSLMCFTETRYNNNSINIEIKSIDENWENIHHDTNHGLALCYNTMKVKLIEEKIQTTNSIEILASIFQFNGEQVLIVLVYRHHQSNKSAFLDILAAQISLFRQRNLRIVILGDFNMDLHDPANINLINNFSTNFQMQQKTTCTTHNDGGILDLILDTYPNGNSVQRQPTPFSDHFMLFYSL